MSADDVNPTIPESTRTNPFAQDTFLGETFQEVLDQNRDIIILLDDRFGRRGTGKTVKSLKIADAMDQTDRGVTFSKCSLQPEEIRNAYASQPPGSGLVLDEGEVGASNRQAMSNTNQALREIMSMGRVEQKYVVINTPIRGFIDKDIQKLCDVWISVYRKGLALVHHLKWEPYSENLLTEKQQWLEISDIEKGTQLRETYNKLSREKRNRIDGDEGQKFVPKEKHEKQLDELRKQVRQETRNEVLTDVYNHPEINDAVSQRMLGEAVGLTQQQVGNIVRNP